MLDIGIILAAIHKISINVPVPDLEIAGIFGLHNLHKLAPRRLIIGKLHPEGQPPDQGAPCRFLGRPTAGASLYL